MKNFKVYMFAVAGCLALTSCSDDDNGGSNNVSSDLVGTYKLSTMTAATAQDYDNDGDSSTNLALEGSCSNSSWISFHDDGTYDQSITRSTASSTGTSLDCETTVSSGTYTRNGDTITAVQTSGSANVSTTYMFNSTSHTISGMAQNASYAGWNATSNTWANLTGNLQVAFTKYTDNDEDNGNNIDADDNVNADASIFSKFNLTSYIVDQAQDYDLDGDSSTNLATEGSCYSSSTIEFKTDGTYEEKFNSTSFSGLTLTCETSTKTGHYTRVGDRVITYNGNSNTSFNLNTAGNILTGTNNNASYAGWNLVQNLWVSLTGNAEMSFTRQNN